MTLTLEAAAARGTMPRHPFSLSPQLRCNPQMGAVLVLALGGSGANERIILRALTPSFSPPILRCHASETSHAHARAHICLLPPFPPAPPPPQTAAASILTSVLASARGIRRRARNVESYLRRKNYSRYRYWLGPSLSSSSYLAGRGVASTVSVPASTIIAAAAKVRGYAHKTQTHSPTSKSDQCLGCGNPWSKQR